MAYPESFGRAIASFLQRENGADADDRADLVYLPDAYQWLHICPARATPRRTYVLSKHTILGQLAPDVAWRERPPPRRTTPSDVTFVSYPPILPVAHAAVIDREIRGSRTRGYFVGDLDPAGLAQWLIATRGGLGAVRSNAKPLKLVWRGLCGELMTRTERRRGGVDVMRYANPMRRLEVDLWAWLRTQSIDWRPVIGERGVALLDSGRTLDMDAAFNSAIVGETGLRDARRWIFDT